MAVPRSGAAELIERRTGFRGNLLRVELDHTREPRGRKGRGPVVRREVVRHPGAVAVLAVTPAREIVLVRQYRYAAGEWLLEIPAGTREPGESPEETAHRELAEETGYRAGTLRPLARFFSAPGFCDEFLHLFRAEELTPGNPRPEAGEAIEVVALPIAEARRRFESGAFRDAKTVAGLGLYLLSESERR